MPLDPAKLTRALKARYGSPARVLARLGLDADLLAPGGETLSAALRIELADLLGDLDLDEQQVERILKTLDKHWGAEGSADRRDDEVTSDDELLGRVHAFLVEKGFSEADIAEAMRILTGGGTTNNPLDPAAPAGFGGRLGMDGRSALEQIRGENPGWASAIRRDDLGTLGLALEQGALRRAVRRKVKDATK